MRKSSHLFLTILFLLFAYKINGQDLVNFYENFNNTLLNDYQYENQNSQYTFNKPIMLNLGNNSYDGEYEINIERLSWWYNKAYLNTDMAISYQMEAVSFPFTADCAFHLGCGFVQGDPFYSDDRILSMPGSGLSFFANNVENYWQYPIHQNAKLYSKTPEMIFLTAFSSGDNGIQPDNPSHSLASAGFNILNNIPIFQYDHQVLPHTIIKHTFYLHCSNTLTSPVVETLQFLYDNTRGQMRFYPFSPNNLITSPIIGDHDVIFIPQIFVNDNFTDFTNPPADILVPNGSLDYFPYAEIPMNVCSPYLRPQSTTETAFFLNPGSLPNFSYIFPPPQALLTAPLRSHWGDFTAGYKLNPFNSNLISSAVVNPSLKHRYQINQNIDLTQINFDEKIIYNPSESNINNGAYNLHFPSHYTFKTIRGVYPSPSEAVAANTPENGGPYADLRDVPVPTDLSPVANESWLASTYTLEAGSQLTFDPCVTIYDASFYVEPQSTLIIENDDFLFGKHRHRIFNQGGLVVLKNQDIFLQNENITGPQQFQFEGKNSIEAGNDVTTLKPNGDYIVEIGSNVNLLSEYEIHLADGFHAQEGSDFHAGIELVNLLPCPPQRPGTTSNSGNNFKKAAAQKKECILFPNPARDFFKVFLSDHSIIETITITNTIGQVILNLSCKNKPIVEIDCSLWNEAVYYVQVKNSSGILANKLILTR